MKKRLISLILVLMIPLLLNTYSKLNIEDLFYEATKISSKLNFSYKNDYILVTLLKASLEKNYIYYLEEFLEKIIDLTYK